MQETTLTDGVTMDAVVRAGEMADKYKIISNESSYLGHSHTMIYL